VLPKLRKFQEGMDHEQAVISIRCFFSRSVLSMIVTGAITTGSSARKSGIFTGEEGNEKENTG